MILDNELRMATTVSLDLGDPGMRSDGSIAPHGPGRQVHLSITGITTGTVDIATGDASTGHGPLITVACPTAETTEVHLPSSCKRWISAAFADGSIDVILDKAQTNS